MCGYILNLRFNLQIEFKCNYNAEIELDFIMSILVSSLSESFLYIGCFVVSVYLNNVLCFGKG